MCGDNGGAATRLRPSGCCRQLRFQRLVMCQLHNTKTTILELEQELPKGDEQLFHSTDLLI